MNVPRLIRSIKKACWLLLTGAMVSFMVYLVIPLGKQQLQVDYSQVILANDDSILRVFLNQEEQYLLSPEMQKTIPENLKQAVLAYEDRYFYQHPGVNPWSLLRAVYLNIKHQKVVSGGSTITMQVARMIRPKPRTYWNKFLEVLLAFKLEAHLTKDEILTQYLTHAPYGSNIRGYLAASHRYFNKKPSQLTWAEACLFAVLPNAPGIIFPTSHTDILKAKRDTLLRQMHEQGLLPQETYELSLLEEIPDRISPFSLHAPHLTDRIHLENDLDIVHTTIDVELQQEVNFFVKQHAAKVAFQGIRNASALVVNNQTGEVAAYVGSQGYHDLDKQGRVDGITSARSSGSILKPFLYALAIDDGLILPQTMIRDIPTYFGSFSPNNATEQFSGVSPANEALIYSLNVPAVRLLNAYGVDKFYNKMEESGVTSLFRSAEDYGLPIILGGAEVTPWDMAKMYKGLANRGAFSDIHYLKGTSNGYEKQVVSPGASFLILDELQELIRPGLEFYWKKYSSQRPVAWKTGTSYGHKDAWAVGTTPKWTVVVWVGNFDGESNKAIAGMQTAGPLLFNIFQVLPEDSRQHWFASYKKDFVTVKTCKETGFYASRSCPEQLDTQAPIHMKPLGICPFHKRYYVEEGHRVCSRCWTGSQELKHQLAYTPDINYYLRQSGNLVNHIPAHHPDCPSRLEDEALIIIYPLEDANVFIPKDFDGDHQSLVAKVASQFPDRKLFWYLDDELVGSTEKSGTFPLNLGNGIHHLMVMDEEGNQDKVRFSAKAR